MGPLVPKPVTVVSGLPTVSPAAQEPENARLTPRRLEVRAGRQKAMTIRQATADRDEYVPTQAQMQTTGDGKIENTGKTAPGKDKAESKTQ